MFLKPSIISIEKEIDRLVEDYGFEHKEENTIQKKLTDVYPKGLPSTGESINEGVKLITNFSIELASKGFVFLFYHIFICSAENLDEKDLIEKLKISNVNIKTYLVVLEKDLNNEHKITIKCQDNMRIIIIHISENDIHKLKDFIKLADTEKKGVVFNVEASGLLNGKLWHMICDFIENCTEKLKMFDVVSTLVFNETVVNLSGNKIIKEDLSNNKCSHQVNNYLYE